ncbi:putative ABC transport system ATP-binding protein [Pustulibacterium marinum]|uniref:Putative ABC transport system ATP-binding protein n=1 Tax=Pustulibacterium marinum TaxID=1224947 RepID=A0A1I7FRT8_9FLAO|nr:ABC transporter ATP-binding protein [Pustulibacterium marinum]SFU38890.1 putative ABC transport system ATP-binding protein [Pustulibacterium marinum]
MKKEIIKIQDLKREFRMGDEIVHALKGISYTIYEGEFVTIMGSSGSGKSTMLNVLGCLDQPSSGIYEIDGVMVKKLSRNELAQIRNEKIGFIFQAYNLLPRTTSIENAELPLLYNSKVSTAERHDRAVKALQKVGLGERLDHTPAQLSGGQQQRVAIARSLVNDPVVILADEATGNLDTRTSYEIMALFQELNRQGKTIVFVTHEPDIAEFSSRTIVLKDGNVIKDEYNTNIQDAAAALAALPKED